jgi:hypothetical protein
MSIAELLDLGRLDLDEQFSGMMVETKIRVLVSQLFESKSRKFDSDIKRFGDIDKRMKDV